MARGYAAGSLPLPDVLSESADGLTRISDAMFRARVADLKGEDGRKYEEQAFGLMRKMLTGTACAVRQSPRLSVYADQIVWGRSPVRIDLAGRMDGHAALQPDGGRERGEPLHRTERATPVAGVREALPGTPYRDAFH